MFIILREPHLTLDVFTFLKYSCICVYQSCSAVALVTFSAGEFFVVGGCSGHGDVRQSEHLCLYPLDASGIHSSLSSSVVTAKNISRHCQMSLGSKTAGGEALVYIYMCLYLHFCSIVAPASSWLPLEANPGQKEIIDSHLLQH